MGSVHSVAWENRENTPVGATCSTATWATAPLQMPQPCRSMWLVVCFACVAVGISEVQGAAVVTGSQPWNIKGQVLVLDVGSLKFQGNHPTSPPITKPDDCRSYCMQTRNCSGWTFCNSTSGCGSGCKAYAALRPKLQIASNGNPTTPQPDWYKLNTINTFGPWGSTAGCKTECDRTYSRCGPAEQWPYGMCSLKMLVNASEPQFYSQIQGEGWVSGWVSIPPQCKGISPRACQRCLASDNLTECLKCANRATQGTTLLASVVAPSYQLANADGCATCFSGQTSQTGKCMECLYENKPCAVCALQTPSSGSQRMDVTACINCTTRYGAHFSGPCTSCAGLAATAGAVTKCMACVARASKVACDSTIYPAGCWNPTAAGGTVCSTCVTSASDYESCVNCVERKPYTDDCVNCASFADTTKQSKCYHCNKKAGSPTTGCSDCLNYIREASGVDQCYQCLMNSKTTAEGKQWCFGCQNWCNSYETRGQCNQCLTTNHSNYVDACVCK